MRIKLLAAGALTGTLVLASLGSAFAAGPKSAGYHFKDLADAGFAQSAITTLAAQGLVNGVSQTTFAPGAPITLGQLAAILLRYQGKVQAQSSFSGQVQTAEREGYFRSLGKAVAPGRDATRAQAMAMIADSLGIKGPATSVQASMLGQFHDKGKVPGWAKGSMALGVQLGLLKGDRGNLMPQGDITRAELAVLLMRLEQLLGLSQTVQSSTVRGAFVSSGTTTNASGQTQSTVTVSVYGAQPVTGSTGSTGTTGTPGSTGSTGGTGSTGTTTTTQTGTSETFTVSPVAQIFYGNQASTLASFKAGDPIFMTLDQDGEAAVIVDTAPTQVETQAGTVTGTVSQVSSSSITIAGPTGGEQEDHGNLQPGTYTLGSSVGVVLGGMAGNISNVQPGDLVRLVVDSSGQVTLIIVKAQALTVSGTVLGTRGDWLMLSTQTGFVRVVADDSTQITLNGQTATMQDVGAGEQVQAQGVAGEGGLVAQTITATGTATTPPTSNFNLLQGGSDH